MKKLVKGGKKAEPDIPVVAMSDIAFLLIIFFLVTTNFMKEGHIKLELPKAEAAEKEDKVKNSVTMDENGDLWINGIATGSVKSDLMALLTEKTGDARKVFFKCHKDILYEEYMAAIEEINGAGAILVLKTDDKKGTGGKPESGKAMKKSAKPAAAPEPPPTPEPAPAGPSVDMGDVLN